MSLVLLEHIWNMAMQICQTSALGDHLQIISALAPQSWHNL